jgi:DNA polymerase III alpha subunit
MGKKKPEEMAKQRITFREGALAKGIAEAKADEVFDLMEKFAGYGFNKSHAAAYSLLAHHTAWIKVHCAAEFYAANMTIEADNTDKLKVLLADALLAGIRFEPPCINRGTARFEPVADTVVRYGLAAVKGTGAGAIEAIVAVREGLGSHQGEGSGPFRSLFDFCARVDRKPWRRWSRPAPSMRCIPTARPRWPAWAWLSTGPTRSRPTPCRVACSTSTAATRTARRRRSPHWRPWRRGRCTRS